MLIDAPLACDEYPASNVADPAEAGTQTMSFAALAEWLAHQDFPGTHARGIDGETPLMRAAWQGEDRVVEALLSYGAEPGDENDVGNNALWFACLQGGPATILRLIQAGAPIDHTNEDEITCLMQAAASGRLEIMQMLLAMGARIDLCAPDGRSAADMAADRGLQLLRAARRLAQPRSALSALSSES